jgi:hypothetical protein
MLANKLILITTLSAAGLASTLFAGRIDEKIRNDFFAGFTGDQAALERAMRVSGEAIALDPNGSAEALAWHGGGLLVLAGQKFQQGDFAAGGELWGKASAEMEKAGVLEPDNPAVLVPRASVWFAASRTAPPQMSKPILTKAIADYEHVYELQKTYFDTLSTHMRGELLFGLADGNARNGNDAKARIYFAKLAEIGPATGHLEQAKLYLRGEKYTVGSVSCHGCHTAK